MTEPVDENPVDVVADTGIADTGTIPYEDDASILSSEDHEVDAQQLIEYFAREDELNTAIILQDVSGGWNSPACETCGYDDCNGEHCIMCGSTTEGSDYVSFCSRDCMISWSKNAW